MSHREALLAWYVPLSQRRCLHGDLVPLAAALPITGLTSGRIKGVADQIAEAGFVVAVPDIYEGGSIDDVGGISQFMSEPVSPPMLVVVHRFIFKLSVVLCRAHVVDAVSCFARVLLCECNLGFPRVAGTCCPPPGANMAAGAEP